MPILRTSARNCVTCKHMKVIYDVECSMSEMEKRYSHENMDIYSINIAYKCTNIHNDGDEEERQRRIIMSFSGKNVVCSLHNEEY